jgi:hypothetical protein
LAWELFEEIANRKHMNIDLVGFFNVVGKIVDGENKKMDNVKDRLVYTAAYPDYVVNESDTTSNPSSNIITYSVVTRQPAPIGTATQLRPIPAAKWRNTETGEVWTLLLTRYIDTIRFDAFAPSAREVENLMCRWERFMTLHMQLIEYVGMEKIVYDGRGVNMTTMKESGYHNRSALYKIITEEHIWRHDRTIDEIVLEYGLGTFKDQPVEWPTRD